MAAVIHSSDRKGCEHILRQLAASGVDHVDLCVSHLGELIQVYFSQSKTLPDGLELAWHWEDEPLGTAGALRVVPDLEGTFIAMNGDVLTTLDYRALVDHHRTTGAALTIAAHAKRVDIDLGVIDSRDGFVTDYREKPSLAYDVSMGIYVYEASALDHLPPRVRARSPSWCCGSWRPASRWRCTRATRTGTTSAP